MVMKLKNIQISFPADVSTVLESSPNYHVYLLIKAILACI